MSDFGVNQGLVEEMFLAWMSNPTAVDRAWRDYFDRDTLLRQLAPASE